MATTYRLRRKTFAANNNDNNKKSGVGKKIGLAAAGTTALAGATALAAMRGKGQLTRANLQSFGKFREAVGQTFGKGANPNGIFKSGGALSGQNLWAGTKGLGQGALNVGKRGWNKAKGWFGGGKGAATQA